MVLLSDQAQKQATGKIAQHAAHFIIPLMTKFKHYYRWFLVNKVKVKVKVKVWIIPFPVLKINFEPLGSNERHLYKKFLNQRPGSGRNNSISCLDNSISYFENQF